MDPSFNPRIRISPGLPSSYRPMIRYRCSSSPNLSFFTTADLSSGRRILSVISFSFGYEVGVNYTTAIVKPKGVSGHQVRRGPGDA